MGRSHFVIDTQFMFWAQGWNKRDPDYDMCFHVSWDDPDEEFDDIKDWIMTGGGEIGGAQWEKNGQAVEACNADLIAGGRPYFAAETLQALEAFKADHKLKGRIYKDEQIVHEG